MKFISCNGPIESGAGEIRTRVRTKRHNAFYMLSYRLGFRANGRFSNQHVSTLSVKFNRR
jgi:hypothetical protein